MSDRYNIARDFARQAERAPHRPAVLFPAGRTRDDRPRFVQLSFAQLHQLSDAYAHGLVHRGFDRGQRVLVMLRPGIELIAVIFALLKAGAVPVLIDPGMGRKAFLQCVRETEPTSMIGIPLAHVLSRLFPAAFRSVRRRATHAGMGLSRLFGGGVTLTELLASGVSAGPFSIADTDSDDEAAVAFTSGSTGMPKGVVYLQGIFRAQLAAMHGDMGIREGDIHLAILPIFALFNPALGVSTVIPDMDPRQPAKVDPARLVEAIETHGVTLSLGSPVVWRKLADHCLARDIHLSYLQHLFLFGASVDPRLVEDLRRIVPVDCRVATPFGATEALPLTLVDHATVLDPDVRGATEAGRGVCVGRPLGDVDIRIIRLSDDVLETWNEVEELPAGELGEIVVRGSIVTREYLHRPQQTALAKIRATDGSLWHRMGDLGYVDTHGRLWVCGRKSHRVETADGALLLSALEAIFDQHPAVRRTALVGAGPRGRQRPVLVVELLDGRTPSGAEAERLRRELLALGDDHPRAAKIHDFLFHPEFPVDVRHNAKIVREALAAWAAPRVRRTTPGGPAT